jgi:hypothetical protein
MTKTFLAHAFASALPALASAQSAPPIPQATHDWGCEVLLCLANPAGPTAVAACEPPIRRLLSALARGHAFPTCTMASGPNGRSYVRAARDHYDRCPQGTSELPAGQLAELAASVSTQAAPPLPSGAPSSYTAAGVGHTYTGIGSGDALGARNGDGSPLTKVCVSGHRGSRDIWAGDTSVTVHRFDQVYVSPANLSAQLLEIYIDDVHWHSVRW